MEIFSPLQACSVGAEAGGGERSILALSCVN